MPPGDFIFNAHASKAVAESPLGGVAYGYLGTLINYGLAVVFVVVLTRFIPLADYGYYTAMLSMTGIIGLFIPSLGVDMAIAREAAALRAKGADISDHASALAAYSLSLSAIYAVAVMAAAPWYLASGVPPAYLGIAALIAVNALVNGAANALSAYLWMMGKVKTQSVGSLVNNLVFRVAEITLVVLLKSVYAIAIAAVAGSAAQLAYYLREARSFPNPRRGLEVLRGNYTRFLNYGLQFWTLAYFSGIAQNVIGYLVYVLLGPNASGLYGLAAYMFGAVASLSNYVTTVFTNRLTYELGRGSKLADAILRDYVLASTTAAGLLAVGAIALAPLLPLLRIVHGDYVAAIPYGAALFGTAVTSAANSLHREYLWVHGRGWRALFLSLPGLAANAIASAALMAGGLGLYGAIAGAYVGGATTTIIFAKTFRDPRRVNTIIAANTALAAAAGWAYAAWPRAWPAAQLALGAAAVATAYIVRPIPRSVAAYLPPELRKLLRPFSSS